MIHSDKVTSPSKGIRLTETRIPDCYLIDFPEFRDFRGLFVKSFKRSDFAGHNLECDFKESFYTESHADVLRGMHFQLPPADHAKLVYCMQGAILDVALDLRVGSPTFGQHEQFELRAEWNNAVYLPRGIAHGFYVRDAPSVVVYQVTSEHSPEHDTGICWNSFGADWPIAQPLISARDEAHIPFAQFQSPFRYKPSTVFRKSVTGKVRA